MFKLDTNLLHWKMLTAQNNKTEDDPVKKVIQSGLQSSCSIYVSSGKKQWSGSGFHIGNGLVITAAHVVPEEEQITELKITFDNKNLLPAEVLVSKKDIDSAVLQCAGASSYPSIEIGDSDSLEIGDIVAVIGAPEGFHDTATVGRVSNIHQTLGQSAPSLAWRDIIFVDADILEGSSGGMVIGIDGKVYGLIMGVTGQHADIGLGENAVSPINKIKSILSKL
jgi:S1-C subfamily serine protease